MQKRLGCGSSGRVKERGRGRRREREDGIELKRFLL
jgi:hypothetical protein